MKDDSRFRRKSAQQAFEIAAAQGDATSCGRKPIAGDVDEHGAAAKSHARPRVVIDLDQHVVEAVGPQQAVAWFIGRSAEWPVVAAVVRVLAPGVVRADAPYR
jgi:hypothetical protein